MTDTPLNLEYLTGLAAVNCANMFFELHLRRFSACMKVRGSKDSSWL